MRIYILSLLLGIGLLCTLNAQVVIDQNTYYQPYSVNDWVEFGNEIYLATDAGIYVIDRASKTIVDHWTRATAGLPSNHIEAIAIHPTTETMYIGTYDIGIGIRTLDGDWEGIPYPEAWLESYNPSLTYCLGFDQSERLLVGTNHGLLRMEDNEWTVVDTDIAPEVIAFSHATWHMERQADGELLLSGNVLLRTQGDEFELMNPLDSVGNPALFCYGSSHLRIQENGDAWLVTDLGEVGRFNGEDWEIWSSFDGSSDISFHQAEFIYEDEEGVLWLYLNHQGYAHYQDGEWSLEEDLPYDIYDPKGIWQVDGTIFGVSGDSLHVFTDEGVVYEELGTYPWEYNLFRFKYDLDQQLWARTDWNTITNLENTEESIDVFTDDEELYAYDYLFDRNNDLWVSSGAAVHHFQNEELVASYSHENSILPAQTSFQNISCDGMNHIWVRTWDEGIYVFDGSEWHYLEEPPTTLLDIRANEVGPGIYILVIHQSEIKLHHLTLNGLEEIDFPNIWSNVGFATYAVDAKTGKLWLANTDGQLAIQQDDGSWEFIDLPSEWTAEDFVRDIHPHERGVWIRAMHQFAFYENGEWYYYNKEILPLDTDRIYDAGLTSEGSLWLTRNTERVVEELITTWTTGPTNVNEIPEQLQAGRAYPNPASSFIQPEGWDTDDALFLNASGQIVQRQAFDGSTELSVNALSPGLYWLIWTANNDQLIAPFVKVNP